MASLEETVVATLEDQVDDTADLVLHHNPLLAVLKAKDLVRYFTGGREIWKAASFYDTAQGGFYADFEAFNLPAVTDLDAFQFGIQQLYEPFAISGREKRANVTEDQKVDLVEQKMKACMSRLKNTFSTSIKGDGTAYSGREFSGIKLMVASSPTSGTYAGIDRSTKAYAQNKTITGITYTSANIQSNLTNAIMAVTRGDEMPDIGFCYPTQWRYLHDSLTAIQRITNNKGQGGFKGKSLEYDGVQFYFDGGYGGPSVAAGAASAVVESGSIRLLNTDYISLDLERTTAFKPLAPTMDRPTDQDAFFTVVIAEGNLCCSAPSLQLYTA